MADDIATKEVIEFPVGDYLERLDAAYAAMMAARDDETPQTMLEEHPFTRLKAEYDALREESKAASREAGTYVVLKEVSRKDWRAIKAAHPPRTEGDPDAVKFDQNLGLNTEDSEDDLLYAALVEPAFTSRAAFDEWADNLGAGKFKVVARRALELTWEGRHNPKDSPASPTRKSD